MDNLRGLRIHITGIVQGVGFRPFIYSIATRLMLTGWVRNTSAGVDIEVDGHDEALEEFLVALRQEAPPLANIDQIEVESRSPDGYVTFEICQSQGVPEAFQPISPDVGICPDCLREMFNPADRRYLYPFINCTNCGPRFTIIKDIPYDRQNTTMAPFSMCPDCAAEYNDPLNRRFHAQPVACPVCGPRIWLELMDQSLVIRDQSTVARDTLGVTRKLKKSTLNQQLSTSRSTIIAVQNLLYRGKIVAVKGLGGFHLACDATNPGAVAALRRRKLRVDKPFALMMADIDTVEKHCFVSPAERQLLESHERPIVILRRRPCSNIARGVAPEQETLGVMLPYTPLHYLLFADLFSKVGSDEPFPPIPSSLSALVMTSGNLSEEPIATDNDKARRHLSSLADAFLMHDRPICTRCDDSVMRVFSGLQPSTTGDQSFSPGECIIHLRRSRGYAPFPVKFPWKVPPLLATGPDLKNTFCITHRRYAFLSHHIGDLENYETFQSFEDGIVHFEHLFHVQPVALAYDLHPDYLTTRYALKRAECENLPAIGVQHHHAHIAACMAEHRLSGDQPVIGVALDGTGYGEDGAIWGGEFMLVDYRGYQRLYHLDYIPLPGGDNAIKEPWRVALAWLTKSGIEWSDDLPPFQHVLHTKCHAIRKLEVIQHQILTGVNAPLTSSMGRLFDAVAALAGVRQVVNYEAQAAIELEAQVDLDETRVYPFEIVGDVINPAPIIRAVVADLRLGGSVSVVSARFHNSVVELVRGVVMAMRNQSGVSEVVLSGGVWQNMVLLKLTIDRLLKENFTVYIHNLVPCNDGGLSLGQAAVAIHNFL